MCLCQRWKRTEADEAVGRRKSIRQIKQVEMATTKLGGKVGRQPIPVLLLQLFTNPREVDRFAGPRT
jgi:hypothetical protein